jgi:hypothetical protein
MRPRATFPVRPFDVVPPGAVDAAKRLFVVGRMVELGDRSAGPRPGELLPKSPTGPDGETVGWLPGLADSRDDRSYLAAWGRSSGRGRG